MIQKLSDRFLFLQLAARCTRASQRFILSKALVPYNRTAEVCFRHHPGLLLLSTKLS
jgi:hypothetical protein